PNGRLGGEGGMISAEPAARVRTMAERAREQPDLIAALCEEPLPAIDQAMGRVPKFRAEYEAYLDKFGDRCMEELKLESATLHDDPLTLLRSVGQLARRLAADNQPPSASQEGEVRAAAEQKVRAKLRYRPIRDRKSVV